MDYTIFKIIASLAEGFVVLCFIITWSYRKEPLAQALLWYFVAVTGFLVANYLELVSFNPSLMILFVKIEHFFLCMISISWLFFALIYSGYLYVLKKSLIISISFITLIYLIVIMTNDIHHLVWVGFNFPVIQGYLVLRPVYGPWFWILSSYYYGMLFLGVTYILISYLKGGSFYRKQAIWILIGFLLPLIFNLIYIFRLIPGLRKDYTPVAFSLTGLFFFVGIFWFRLLQLSPLSRNIILNDLKHTVIVLDKFRRIIDFNTEASIVFHLEKESLGKMISETSLSESITSQELDGAQYCDMEFVKPFENDFYDFTLKEIYIKGKAQGILVNITNITDKILLIKELENSNKQLQEMQAKLIQQEKLVAIGHLAAGVAHEINNPLSFIKSNIAVSKNYLERLRKFSRETESSSRNSKILDGSLESLEEILEDSEEGILRITEVVKNLLSFSRNDSTEKTSVYNLNQGIESTLVIARNITKDKAIVELNLQDVPSILTRGNEINQVLLNLISNAAQSISGDRGDGHIIISTFVEDDHIICEVMDNGNPISEELKDKIFEPFFSTKKKEEGTGIGLGISRDIIEQSYQGMLFLKPGDEKIFRIEIPIDSN